MPTRRYARQPPTEFQLRVKAATAAYKKDQRRNRWKRPPPAISHVIRYPPAATADDGHRDDGEPDDGETTLPG